jgi:signal transduction histidine kinase
MVTDSMDETRVSEGGGSTEIRSGRANFRPRARLLRTLGHELITNELIALQELVKNAYDADAHRVVIAFEDPVTPGKGAVTVSDDGVGMSLETLLGAWMEPATFSKVQRNRSKGERRVTGEKGIGRFAASRVARVLELTSVSAQTGRRIRARFDWGRFDDATKYLDEVACDWIEEPAAEEKSGTALRLVHLRDDWSRNDGAPFQGLRAQMSRLVSPVTPPEDFTIHLETPDAYLRFAGEIRPPEVLRKPKYWLAGTVSANGEIDAAYEGPDGTMEILEHGQKPRVLIDRKRPPSCGPFSFEFRVWDRSTEDLRPLATEFGSSLRDLKRDLDAASGIGIYRDGFRVMLPENTDWLRLDLRRVQNPTMRLSNNQIVGVVSITRDANSGLIDQTNRQGIVDSPEFSDFRDTIREVLSKLEIKRELVRRAPDRPSTQPGGVFGKISIASLRDFVAANYGSDSRLKQVVEETERSIAEGVAEVKTVLVRYRRLATLGQIVDGILHEGRTPVAAITNAIRFLEKDINLAKTGTILTKPMISRMRERFETILQQSRLLGELFRRIAPFSGRQRGRPRTTTMERVLADTVALLRREIKDAVAVVELPEGETTVTVDEADMQGIFRNLIENALYWLTKVPPEERRIAISLQEGVGELQVIVSDNGPGVPDEIRDRIMDPYFTTRPEGQGLGLALAGELAAEYDGNLDLMADGPLNGATFRVILRRHVG